MSEPKSYTFRTFQELVDRVPADRIVDCMTELGEAFSIAKLFVESVVEGGVPSAAMLLEEEHTWVDDGKHNLSVTMESHDGSNLIFKVEATRKKKP